MKIDGKAHVFKTKLVQVADMLVQLALHFKGVNILCFCDSWFGNNGFFKPVRKYIGNQFDLLSRLRSNTVIYALPFEKKSDQAGRPRKYGIRLGTCAEMAAMFRNKASQLRVFLYGDYREVMFYSTVVILKTLKCPIRVVWIFRKTQWIAIFSTDLDLSIKQII